MRLIKSTAWGSSTTPQNAIDATMRLIAAILLQTAAAWGPQDKATKLPRLWLPTATPVIAGERAPGPSTRPSGASWARCCACGGATRCACLIVAMGEWLASYEDDRVVAKEQTREAAPATPGALLRADKRSALRY